MPHAYPPVSLSDIVRSDPDDTLVLSVNNRHARRILTELTALLGESRWVMAVPDIVPLGAWLMQVADHLSFQADHDMPAHTADSFGAVYLWQRVINDAEPDHTLLDVAQAARLACEADRLLDDWRIDVQPEEKTADHQRFLTWRENYRTRLEALDLEDSNLAHERVCRAFEEGVLHLPVRHLVLAGFSDVSPRLAGLLNTIQAQGITLSMLEQPPEVSCQVQRIQAPDHYAEWRLAAQWARDQLVADPNGCYAIVAPRLEADVALAHRVLRHELGQQGLVFNVAVGRPLAEWPLVRAALAWLKVAVCHAQGRSCPVSDLGQALLAGGCAAHRAEASHRARLDARLRHAGVLELSANQFASELNERVPQLGRAWQECMENVMAFAGRKRLSEWAIRIRDVLQALGFPGDAPLDSPGYQALDAFDQMIDHLGRQEPVAGAVGFNAAVGMVLQLARETPFQPQRDPHSRLDVLGFLESEGGRWDGVWVLGLTDDVLPAAPQPNPLIPMPALRRAGAPRATPEREFQWAQSIYSSLLACAPSVWLSHPERDGERELRASPCIEDLPLQEAAPRLDNHPAWPLEYVVDEQGPALGPDDPGKGGIALIDAQARNPLWAFARFRLGVRLLPDYAVLLDHSARGLFLHRAMELFWSMIADQGKLHDLKMSGRLTGMVQEVAEQAADDCLTDAGPMLRSLEVQRSCAILLRWLELEMQREPFEVMAVEQRERWTHGPLELSVRLDRVDRLADGRLGVIDYKSGASAPDPRHSWARERPVDLQLPFYASLIGGQAPEVAALIQAYLHSRKTDTAGLSDGDCGLTGVSHFTKWPQFEGLTWKQVLQGWQDAIRSMADEFVRGHAPNTSFDDNDLMYCDVLPFLRLTEDYARDDNTAQ